MREWVLCVAADGSSSSFFPVDQDESWLMAERDGEVEVWRTVAKGRNAAMQARNDHLGWGPYQPVLDDAGKPVPEDEDDDRALRLGQ